MIKAVIDLGTNTFHLLIAETDLVRRVKPLKQKRAYVFLASHGLDQIHADAINRAVLAAQAFKDIIDGEQVDKVLVTGTEALRKASNGRSLARQLENILQCPIQIIPGNIEAQLIGRGVEAALGATKMNAIAIDIGGGSTEIVYLEDGLTKDFISATCGIAYLHNRFHNEEPMPSDSISEIENYIRQTYGNFIQKVKEQSPQLNLIGVAGSFEILAHTSDTPLKPLDGTQLTHFNIDIVDSLINQLLPLNELEREALEIIPSERSLYIVEALLIIRSIAQMADFDNFYISEYSIKHGLMLSDF